MTTIDIDDTRGDQFLFMISAKSLSNSTLDCEFVFNYFVESSRQKSNLTVRHEHRSAHTETCLSQSINQHGVVGPFSSGEEGSISSGRLRHDTSNHVIVSFLSLLEDLLLEVQPIHHQLRCNDTILGGIDISWLGLLLPNQERRVKQIDS
jgi:hypothetical protein